MTEHDRAKLAIVNEWIVKGENDLTAAVQILKLGEAAPTETIGFHAQQCVEKYLKALLVFHEIPFPKTHNIRVVLRMVPTKWRPDLEENVQDRLTEYAAITRYPQTGSDITLRDARKALASARRVRKQIRRLMPRAALSRKKK